MVEMAHKEVNSTDSALNMSASGEAAVPSASGNEMPRDWKFWCIFLSMMISILLTAVEFTAIGTALPVIVNSLHGEQFVWIGTAYTLGSTAPLPLCGGLAQILGRRAVMLGALFFFSAGSAISGAAPTMNALIAGRTIQGVGGGGITALTQIIIADLVPLRERGSFNGLMAIAWGLGGGVGPIIGGSLAERGQWRWIFYLNLPICGVAAILVSLFLRLKTPQEPWYTKLSRMDWIGNFLVIASTTSIVIGLTWGGVQAPWSAAKVLVPLILGLVGLCGFFVYEAFLATHPIVPVSMLANRTALSGYIQNFLMGVVLATIAYWLPVYFQATKDAGPIAAGVDIFGISYSVSPFCLIAGAVIQKTQRYRQPMWFGWALMVIGTSLLSTLAADTSRAKSFGYQIMAGSGIGIIYVAAYFPVLAPIPVTKSAPALAFYTFLRNFALVWGVTIGGAILQNELKKNLPEAFLDTFPENTDFAFAAIPLIKDLGQPTKDQVRVAFANALQVVWEVMAGISAAGFVISLAMKHLPLHTSVDRDWGRQEGIVETDAEMRGLNVNVQKEESNVEERAV